MVSRSTLFPILLVLSLTLSACGGSPAQEGAAAQPPIASPTLQEPSLTPEPSATRTPTETPPTPTSSPSSTLEDLLYCPEVIPADTPFPEDVSITRVELDFDTAPSDYRFTRLYWAEGAFVSISIGVDNQKVIEGFSEDGLNWEDISFSARPPASDAGLTDLPSIYGEAWYLTRPGFGGQVDLVTGNGPSGLCLPAPDGTGKQFQLLPFGPFGEYQNPRLIGIVEGTIVLLIQYQEKPAITYPLGDATVELVPGPDGFVMIDQATGEEVVWQSGEESGRFVYLDSGETLAELSKEKFAELTQSNLLNYQATQPAPVEHLAWSSDRGLSWSVAELPGQSPDRWYQTWGAVSPDGTVALLAIDSPTGQLIDPAEIEGQLTQEQVDQALENQDLFDIEDLAFRTELPIVE